MDPNFYITEKQKAKFLAAIEKTNGCWIWKAGKDKDGYGTIYIGRHYRAHRVSYMIHCGAIPADNLVCHTCDNPSCVNPLHLFIGSSQDNVNDMVKKGRQAKGDRCGCRLYPERVRAGIIKSYKENPGRILSGDKHWMRQKPELIRKGEECRSKLTAEKVVEIRDKYKTGKFTYLQLAKIYGVDFSNIYSVVKRKSWKHIP